tara:strand:+ start:1325 stop:2128 length:804 start_codon:yes stop_codon:yes gene_type:complete
MKTIFCDIDGTLLKHHGDLFLQITEYPELLDGVKDKLTEWDRKGYNIILVTGRRECSRKETEEQLARVGIFYDQLIMGIGAGERVLINDLKPTVNTTMAHAINIERNEGIKHVDVDDNSAESIRICLQDYQQKINAEKSGQLTLSKYKVSKPWGHEVWLELNNFYVYKMIHMKEGYRSSLQSHKFKFESNFVIEGEAEVLLENDNGHMESHFYKAGDGWSVPVGRKHRVIAKTTYTALEVSTPHLDDVIRYEDDTDRQDGKITKEHS